MADAAGRTVDKNAAAVLDSGGIHERLPGGQPDHWDRRGPGVVEPIWLSDEDAGRTDDVVGVSAVALRERQQAKHVVTGLVKGDPRADGVYGARDVPAEDEWGLADERAGLAVRAVDWIHASRVHADPDLADPGLWDGKVDELQDFGFAELILAHRPHRAVHDAATHRLVHL